MKNHNDFRVIPLFPLPNVVFFPKTYLPLHIFEPRYQEMVQDIEEEDRIIGIVLLKEGWEMNYYDRPEICSIGCAGEMVKIERLEEGRFNIILKGLYKFSVKDQYFDKSYRQAFVETFLPNKTEEELPKNIKKILTSLLQKQRMRLKSDETSLSHLKTEMDDETFVNMLSFALPLSNLEKQFLLDSENLVRQTKRLIELIQLQTFETNPPSESG